MENDKYNADGVEKKFQNSNVNMKRAINIIKNNELSWWMSYKKDFALAFSLHAGRGVGRV